jgi:hypothetical protein
LGLDFISTCAPGFTKGWDSGLADIQAADLLTDLPCETSRTYRATAEGITGVHEGDTVFLRPSGDTITVIRGRTRVGVIRCPPPSLVETINAVGRGIATGTVSKLYKRSGDFEVRVN